MFIGVCRRLRMTRVDDLTVGGFALVPSLREKGVK